MKKAITEYRQRVLHIESSARAQLHASSWDLSEYTALGIIQKTTFYNSLGSD
jgi:hypothetical protein